MFVGRDSELATLADQLAVVRGGAPRVVLITAPAGAGKSALLRHFLGQRGPDAGAYPGGAGAAPEVVGVSVSGDEAEALYPFGLLDQLTRQLGDGGRTGPGDGVPDDPFLAGADLLDLLGRVQASAGHRPLVLTVDDAQWVEPPRCTPSPSPPAGCTPTGC